MNLPNRDWATIAKQAQVLADRKANDARVIPAGTYPLAFLGAKFIQKPGTEGFVIVDLEVAEGDYTGKTFALFSSLEDTRLEESTLNFLEFGLPVASWPTTKTGAQIAADLQALDTNIESITGKVTVSTNKANDEVNYLNDIVVRLRNITNNEPF